MRTFTFLAVLASIAPACIYDTGPCCDFGGNNCVYADAYGRCPDSYPPVDTYSNGTVGYGSAGNGSGGCSFDYGTGSCVELTSSSTTGSSYGGSTNGSNCGESTTGGGAVGSTTSSSSSGVSSAGASTSSGTNTTGGTTGRGTTTTGENATGGGSITTGGTTSGDMTTTGGATTTSGTTTGGTSGANDGGATAGDAGSSTAIGSACACDADCGPGQFCFPLLNYASGADAGTAWVNGYCTLYNCDQRTPCPDGAICYNYPQGSPALYSLCLASCDSSACQRSGYTCSELGDPVLACLPECVHDCDCSSGLLCESGSCQQPCYVDSECGPNEICNGNRCQAGPPLACCDAPGMAPCPDGMACQSGMCIISCQFDVQCPAGERCLSNGECG